MLARSMLCGAIVEAMTNPINPLRSYSELSKLLTFRERYEYLKLNGLVGVDTFGTDRYLNQKFYKSFEWKRIRDYVIIRDGGNDLGVEGFTIHGTIYIHHMNPITPSDIRHSNDIILDPEYLIATTLRTHNAIHYGEAELLMMEPIERTPHDTSPWRTVKKEIL